MARRKAESFRNEVDQSTRTEKTNTKKSFRLEYKNQAQKLAYSAFCQHDVLFLLGPAGTGKTHLSTAFGISEILSKQKSRLILSRPVVEAGEKLGYLPGTLEEKVDPYMLPLYDCITTLVGKMTPDREKVDRATELAPLAFLRGRTFKDSICILDEAQNASFSQIKMFLTRFGDNSKIIITGDPKQSDLPGPVALNEVVRRLKTQPGIGIIEFSNDCIVRHPLVGKILERLEAKEDKEFKEEKPKEPKEPSLVLKEEENALFFFDNNS